MVYAESLTLATTWTGIITALGVLLTALATVVAAYTNYKATNKVDTKVVHVRNDVKEVHKIVNQQRTDMLNELALLRLALVRAEGKLDAELNVPRNLKMTE